MDAFNMQETLAKEIAEQKAMSGIPEAYGIANGLVLKLLDTKMISFKGNVPEALGDLVGDIAYHVRRRYEAEKRGEGAPKPRPMIPVTPAAGPIPATVVAPPKAA